MNPKVHFHCGFLRRRTKAQCSIIPALLWDVLDDAADAISRLGFALTFSFPKPIILTKVLRVTFFFWLVFGLLGGAALAQEPAAPPPEPQAEQGEGPPIRVFVEEVTVPFIVTDNRQPLGAY